jgi:hypothetical protein
VLLQQYLSIIKEKTGASGIYKMQALQTLWSGYGHIIRYGLKHCKTPSVIVKHIHLPDSANHPRGWNTSLSHQRKIRSYQVETNWYKHWSRQCDAHCRIPACLAVSQADDDTENTNEIIIVLEDLDVSGFPERKQSVSIDDMFACLSWLAYFHARFMAEQPVGLWETGTYWHLDTRPDELQALTDSSLKQAAAMIDQILKKTPYQTLVHGDAKLANFCFSDDAPQVAAVDFQYVGQGCGMKDVAYFIGSCLYEEDCERYETLLLDYYFARLKKALIHYHKDIDFAQLEQDWRALYPVAWTDFHRFIKGWSPGHWKIHGYSERLARQVIQTLSPEQRLDR